MSKRWTCLLAAGALILPLPAYADCADRIAAVESHPAVVENPEAPAASPEAATPGTEEAVVKAEMVENGDAVMEDGGETVHAEGGPALPRESWFTGDTDKGAVLTHLDAAREARSSGDEKACIEQVQQAEELLQRDDAG